MRSSQRGIRHQSTSRPPPSADDENVIQVFLSDATYKNVRVNSDTNVHRIISVLLAGLGMDDLLSREHFAIRMRPDVPPTSVYDSAEATHWLHPAMTVPQFTKRYIDAAPTGLKLRFELRIRFISPDLDEMCRTQLPAFLYLYDQLQSDYVQHAAWKIDSNRALQMAALAIRKRFSHLTKDNLEKKLDFGLIEQEGGLIKYLPEAFIINTKRKEVQKTIIAAVRKVVGLSELECIFEFLRLLADMTPFDQEIFRASIGAGWQSPADVFVGPELGISYTSHNSKIPASLTSLQNITQISLSPLNRNSPHSPMNPSKPDSFPMLVHLKLAGAQPLTLTLPTLTIAESFAHLLDGYYRFLLGGTGGGRGHRSSIWWPAFLEEGRRRERGRSEAPAFPSTLPPCLPPIRGERKGSSQSDPRNYSTRLNGNPSFGKRSFQENALSYCFKGPSTSEEFQEGDYAASMFRDLHIDRRSIRLEELLGDGQFGNVYRAVFEDQTGAETPVAVKVCKAENDVYDTQTANKYLLDEAYTMAQFRHPHIVKLVGVCRSPTSDIPSWIVMELAPLGELRAYLQHEKHGAIDLSVQIIFAHQLASAVAYLHSKQFLHRDVAARNCLVSSPKCVKLSDFGLSRMLENENVYTASRGKLPIKWLPPESINYRKFSTQSDVYMFGVCVWEILMYGVKPWQGVRNHEVILRVERGEILLQPDGCPDSLYSLMKSTWVLDPKCRPTMVHVKDYLGHLLNEIDRQVPFNKLSAPDQSKESRKYSNPRKDSNARKSSVNEEYSVLLPKSALIKADVSEIATSTLWRTLEEQRVQCDEDDKWLEEVEGKMLSRPAIESRSTTRSPAFSETNTSTSPSMSSSEHLSSIRVDISSPKSPGSVEYLIPAGMELDREGDRPHSLVVSIVKTVSNLSNKYASKAATEEFLDLVDKIKQLTRELLDESESHVSAFKENDHRQVILMRTLVNSDLRNIGKSVNEISPRDLSTELLKRDVLRIAHILAVNCKNFLDSIDTARLKCGSVKLKQSHKRSVNY
ncbi:protein tyrosine kinase domain-containing protein [Ditylenchus destructor]|nr:protein tyrosine kinase domain-containing protein [Ditylenchus destructor]